LTTAQTISRLVSLGGRWPGSEGERRAAEQIAAELEAMGHDAVIEPTIIRPAYHLAHAINVGLAVVGAVVSVSRPALGVALLLIAAVSMYGDLAGRFQLARRLMPRRRSQNVTSRGDRPDAPARLVLLAHHDAGRSGLIYNRRRRPSPRLVRALATLAGPIDLIFWAVICGLLLAVARLLLGLSSGEGTPLTIAQFADVVLLLIAFMLLVDVALSDAVPGANGNASGVAAALALGRRLSADPPANLDVWLVFPGAEEGLMLGMREWLRAHRDELDPRRTFFVNLDSVGRGRVRAVGAEGFIVISRHDARLLHLARSAAGRLDEDQFDPDPYTWRTGTDATIPLGRGYSTITICATDESGRVPGRNQQSDTIDRIEPRAIEAAVEICEGLARAINSQLVPLILPSLEPPPEAFEQRARPVRDESR
jgi:hypothetical protein